MLELKDVHVYYEGIHALKGISLQVEEASIVSLIGANGAGKSTTLKAICNMIPYQGSITLKGQDLKKIKTHEIVHLGMTMVPEGRRIFTNLNVKENLELGGFSRKDRKEIERDLEWVFSLFPRLKEREKQQGGTLSGGEQQMLALGRALMSRPKLLMMDEPSLGLAPNLVIEIFKMIETIHQEKVTILLIEQNAHMALKVADYGYVLETGSVAIEGPGKELIDSSKVKEAYLGREVEV